MEVLRKKMLVSMGQTKVKMIGLTCIIHIQVSSRVGWVGSKFQNETETVAVIYNAQPDSYYIIQSHGQILFFEKNFKNLQFL